MRAFRAPHLMALTFLTLIPAATEAQDRKEDILTITTARIDQLLTGLAAEYAVWEPARARDEQKMRAAEAAASGAAGGAAASANARERFDRCSEPILAADTGFQRYGKLFQQKYATMSPAQMQAIGTRMNRYQQRLDALGPDGDKAETAALQDSVRQGVFEITGMPVAEQARMETRIRTAVEKACGKEPPRRREQQEESSSEPPPPEQLETDTLISDAGLKKTGLAPRQYTILRERVTAWLLASTGDRDIGDYVFTAAEKTALNQRVAALRKYTAMLESTGHWQFD